MVKGLALLKRNPGLSPEEFRKHYEEVHAPLALKLVPTIRKYVRNHITTIGFSPGAEEPEFDCITEQWFDNMDGFQAMMDIAASETGRALREDMEKLLDSSKTVYLLVEEVASEIVSK